MMSAKFLEVCKLTTFLNVVGLFAWQYIPLVVRFFDFDSRDLVMSYRHDMLWFHGIFLGLSVLGCVVTAAARSIALEEASKRGY